MPLLKIILCLLWPLALYGQKKEKTTPDLRQNEEYTIPIDRNLGVPVPKNFPLFCSNTSSFFKSHLKQLRFKQDEIFIIHVIRINRIGQIIPTTFQYRRGMLEQQNLVIQYEKSVLKKQDWIFKSAYNNQLPKKKEYSSLLQIELSIIGDIKIWIRSLDETHEFSCTD